MTPAEIYDAIELTEEELKAAILEGKKKKYFHEKNKDYWEKQERPMSKKKVNLNGAQK